MTTTHRERLEALEQPTRLQVRLRGRVKSDGWIPGFDYPQHGRVASTDDLIVQTATRGLMAGARALHAFEDAARRGTR